MYQVEERPFVCVLIQELSKLEINLFLHFTSFNHPHCLAWPVATVPAGISHFKHRYSTLALNGQGLLAVGYGNAYRVLYELALFCQADLISAILN